MRGERQEGEKLSRRCFRLCDDFSFFSSMTKTEMVDCIAKSAAIAKKAAAAALEAVISAVTKELKKGNNVVITGFGATRNDARRYT